MLKPLVCIALMHKSFWGNSPKKFKGHKTLKPLLYKNSGEIQCFSSKVFFELAAKFVQQELQRFSTNSNLVIILKKL